MDDQWSDGQWAILVAVSLLAAAAAFALGAGLTLPLARQLMRPDPAALETEYYRGVYDACLTISQLATGQAAVTPCLAFTAEAYDAGFYATPTDDRYEFPPRRPAQLTPTPAAP